MMDRARTRWFAAAARVTRLGDVCNFLATITSHKGSPKYLVTLGAILLLLCGQRLGEIGPYFSLTSGHTVHSLSTLAYRIMVYFQLWLKSLILLVPGERMRSTS